MTIAQITLLLILAGPPKIIRVTSNNIVISVTKAPHCCHTLTLCEAGVHPCTIVVSATDSKVGGWIQGIRYTTIRRKGKAAH
jgi:hypothetical protein